MKSLTIIASVFENEGAPVSLTVTQFFISTYLNRLMFYFDENINIIDIIHIRSIFQFSHAMEVCISAIRFVKELTENEIMSSPS